MKPIINTTINFLSSKINLTIIQCILYFILGYILREYTWTQCIIIFVVLLGIQFITHIKSVSQGMVMFQLMEEDNHHFMQYIKNLEKLDNDIVDDNDDLPN